MLTRKYRSSKYDIHYNGDRPFYVTITENSVAVSNTDNLFTIKANEIFIGKKSPGGGYDGLTANKAEGNTILLKLNDKYMFIGNKIYEFKPMKEDTIVKYYSNIGNNDVPHPYAIGKTHIYLMLDKVAVDKSYFNMKDDIYDQYYKNFKKTKQFVKLKTKTII